MIRSASRLFIVFALTMLTPGVQAVTISDVSANRVAFDPAGGEHAAVRFRLDAPATVELRIYDGRDVLVRRIRSGFPAGEHSLSWDGRDARQEIVPPEAYHYALHAETASGEQQTYDLTDKTGGERITVQAVEWRSERGHISYRLPERARVSIRVGLKNHGPLLRTLIDWVPRPAGLNHETWDGWDNSEVLELSAHPKLNIFVDAYSLSDNTLLVGTPPRKTDFIDVDRRIERDSQPADRKLMHHHHQQPLESRGDIGISVSLPAGLPRDDDGLPVVNGRVPVRLEVDPVDRRRALDRRFEPVFFVDGNFAFENEVGYLPFTWIWDTANTNPGTHYITANLRGYEGNFGIATIKVRVRDESSD